MAYGQNDISFDVGTLQTNIDKLSKTLSEMKQLQAKLCSSMEEVRSYWETSGSVTAFEKLDTFIGEDSFSINPVSADSKSVFSGYCNNIALNIEKLEKIIPYLNSLDELGS